MNPEYPIYIISKGRWDSRLTSKTLENMKVPYHIVVEPQEYDKYSAVIDPDKIYTLPFSNLGQGSIPARNWVWEHSIKSGYDRHWIMDDNIRSFKKNRYICSDGTHFKVIEDFIDRYENIAMVGPDYDFMGRKQVTRRNVPPFIMNTRIYSCICIKNDIPYRWRGRYNEDTDLSLRVLKDGMCTILFYFFTQSKQTTMTMKGGNTDELYKQDNDFDGRLEMAKHLQRQHPDVTKITRKWGGCQHQVDYRPFKKNRLIKKEGITIPKGVNNYGMVLVKKDD